MQLYHFDIDTNILDQHYQIWWGKGKFIENSEREGWSNIWYREDALQIIRRTFDPKIKVRKVPFYISVPKIIYLRFEKEILGFICGILLSFIIWFFLIF